MWNTAKQAVSMISASMTGLELIGGLSRATDKPREALGMISAIVMGLIEGFQGKLASRDVEDALLMLKAELTSNQGVPTTNLTEKFRDAL